MSGAGGREEQALLARLLGGLVPAHPGARGLYHLTLNPRCNRLRVATAAGLSMRQVAEVLGVQVREGQSVFALDRGIRFEERLYESGAARLLELFRTERGWPVADCRVLDLRDVAPLPGGSAEAAATGLARRAAATQRALAAKAAGDPHAYNLLVQPVLLIQVVGVAYPIIPDLLAASSAEPFYTPGEVKSFPDRGSKTDPADVAAATRQAAVAMVGLRQWAAAAPQPARLVGTQAHLVFARPGSLQPTLHTQSVRHEVAVLDRALAAAPADLRDVAAALPPDATLADPATLEELPTCYREVCRTFCPLAEPCKAQAIAAASPVLLGTAATGELAGISDLRRAAALLFGDATPTPEETATVGRLRADLARDRRARCA